MKLQLDLNTYGACPQYNDWLDEQYLDQSGTLDVLGFQPRPSLVLFSLSQDTYQAGFADFLQQREDDIREIVFNEFPFPIAYYFYRFEHGYESELQRLYLLRDTWEAIIDVLHAMTLAECRFRKTRLAPPIAFADLLTDSMAQRLLNIERIVDHANSEGVTLDVSNIASVTTLRTMRHLNQSRNGFSHSAAQSESQARGWIGECHEDVVDVLDDLRRLATVEVLRYMGQIDANTLRCEVFRGHGATRTIRPVTVTGDQLRDSQRYFQQGQVLAVSSGHILSLRPMVDYHEDAMGHATRVCLFRKTRGDALQRRLEYEIVGEAKRRDVDRAAFRVELTELRGLFGLGQD